MSTSTSRSRWPGRSIRRSSPSTPTTTDPRQAHAGQAHRIRFDAAYPPGSKRSPNSAAPCGAAAPTSWPSSTTTPPNGPTEAINGRLEALRRERTRIPQPHPLPLALTAAQRRPALTRQCTLNYEEPVKSNLASSSARSFRAYTPLAVASLVLAVLACVPYRTLSAATPAGMPNDVL